MLPLVIQVHSKKMKKINFSSTFHMCCVCSFKYSLVWIYSVVCLFVYLSLIFVVAKLAKYKFSVLLVSFWKTCGVRRNALQFELICTRFLWTISFVLSIWQQWCKMYVNLDAFTEFLAELAYKLRVLRKLNCITVESVEFLICSGKAGWALQFKLNVNKQTNNHICTNQIRKHLTVN